MNEWPYSPFVLRGVRIEIHCRNTPRIGPGTTEPMSSPQGEIFEAPFLISNHIIIFNQLNPRHQRSKFTSPGIPIFRIPSGFGTLTFTAYTWVTRSSLV